MFPACSAWQATQSGAMQSVVMLGEGVGVGVEIWVGGEPCSEFGGLGLRFIS